MKINLAGLRDQAESTEMATEILRDELLALVTAVELARQAWCDFGNNVCIDTDETWENLDEWLDARFEFKP